jgi:spore coat polysaccharide biosynthesis protein SpsF
MLRHERQRKGSSPVDRFQSKYVMAFLQARMNSTRLPGKVMMAIRGQSILERAIRRLRAAPIVDEVAVLTTCLRDDDVIVEEARRLGAPVHRGPERDVLARFYEAAQKFRPDIIIRATADNPLIDIGSIDRIVQELRSRGLDYCMEKDLPYGAATEAFTVEALTRSHFNAVDAYHREHVTPYIREHSEEFSQTLMIPPDFLCHPQVRITVDTPEDLVFMDRLIGLLPQGEQQLPLGEYIPLALSILHERECKALAIS